MPSPSPPAPHSQSPELEMILQELATAKIHHVETLHGLELKSLELRGALQREKTVKQELEQARVLIDTLIKKVCSIVILIWPLLVNPLCMFHICTQ